MQAVVPAAGAGTRLRPLTDDRPKGLVEVGGRPLLTHCFEQLVGAGIAELVVVVGYRTEDIIGHYGDRFRDVPITYVHQREQLGLGHAVLQAESHVDGDFVVFNGDNVVRANLDEVIAVQRRDGVDAAILVEPVSAAAASKTGVVEIDDGHVTGLVEKPDDPPSTVAVTGCYVLPPDVFHALRLVQPSDRGEYELSDAVDLLATAGYAVKPVRLDGWRVNVNTPADVDEAERRLRR